MTTITRPTIEDLKDYCHIDVGGGKIVKNAQLTWVMTVESDEDNPVDLPGEPYDPDEDHSPKITLHDGIQEWLIENMTGKVYFGLSIAYFENEEDAMAFKLKWT